MARNGKETRMCAGCRQHKNKSELIRVYRLGTQEIQIDVNANHSGGRGIYICKNLQCLQTAIKKKSFSRSFHCDIPQDLYKAVAVLAENSDSE